MSSRPQPSIEGRFRYGIHELAYEVVGDHGVPCVLMHGLLLDSLLMRDLAERFAAEGYQVILLDLLGHGKSDKPIDPRELRVDFFAEHVIALLNHLAIPKALIGGASLGAIVALHMAVKAPERCLGLFIEMPVMEWSTMFAAILLIPLIGLTDFASALFRPMTRVVRRIPRPSGLRMVWLASVLNAASADPAVTTAILHGLLVGPVVPPSWARRKLTMPTLIIGHGNDRLHAMRDAAALAEELPNSQLIQATWIGELRTRPERLLADIRPFLTQLRLSTMTDDLTV